MKHIFGAETAKLEDYAKEKAKSLTDEKREELFTKINEVRDYEAISFLKIIEREKIYTLVQIEEIFD